jgi:protocatechuate 3,4-dioxygenase beta subunit
VVAAADVVLAEGGITPFPLRGRTGADGKVTLGPIGPGPASVSASARGFVPRGAVPVPEVLHGPVRIPLLPGGTLAGRVVDARGFPVDGATIEVIGTDLWGLPVAETPLLSAFQRLHFAWALPGPTPLIPAGELGVMPGPVPPIPQPGQTDTAALAAIAPSALEGVEPWVTRADGHFEATPVTPGRVRAIVRHPAYVEGMSKVVQLAPGGRAEVEVVLRVGGTLEGRVLDAAGMPVASARVDVSALRGTLERTTVTASDGTFAFAAVPSSVEIAVARPEDFARMVLKRTVDVPEGGRTEVEIILPEPREAVTVKVVDEDGRAVEAAQITLMSLDPVVPLRETHFTSSEGAVAIQQARGLDLRISAEAPGFTRAMQVVERAPELVQVTLRRGILVTGKVTAVRGRVFAAGASVVLVAEGVRRAAFADAEGGFRFSDVPAGPVRLVVSHPEYASAEVDVLIAATERADRPRELEPIDLSEAGSAEGEVVDAEGQPVLGARVAAGFVPAYLPAGALPAEVAVTDGKGRFTLGKLAPGPLELEAYHAQVGRGRVRARVDAGRTLSGLKIRLEAAASEDEPARPGGVAVTLGARGGGGVVVVHVAEASEAERAGLEPDDVIVSIDGTEPASLNDARERLAGAPGSGVVLRVRRGSGEERLHVTRELVRR